MLTIERIALQVPPSRPFKGVQAQPLDLRRELQTAQIASPWESGRNAPDAVDRQEAGRVTRLPMAGADCSLSDLALGAVAALQAKSADGSLRSATHVNLVHGSLNEMVAESVVTRLQHALALPDALAFAVGQCGTLGLYSALPVLAGMLGPRSAAVVVSADKWRYPNFRVYGDLVAYADCAAALVLRRGAGTASAHEGAATLRGYAFAYGQAITHPRKLAEADLGSRLLDLMSRAASQALHRAGLHAGQVECLAPAGFSESFAKALARRLEIAPGRLARRDQGAHLSSSDAPASMAAELARLAPGERRIALFCDAALCGIGAAMVVELCGAASPPPD